MSLELEVWLLWITLKSNLKINGYRKNRHCKDRIESPFVTLVHYLFLSNNVNDYCFFKKVFYCKTRVLCNSFKFCSEQKSIFFRNYSLFFRDLTFYQNNYQQKVRTLAKTISHCYPLSEYVPQNDGVQNTKLLCVAFFFFFNYY